MRIIKFRAWNAQSKFMYSPDDNNSEMFMYLDGLLCYDGNPVKDDKWILMQFTGLLDKNGKEIYEGDIVQIPDRYTTMTLVVKYKGACFFFCKHVSDCFDKPITYATECPAYREVIGNIYENLQLLKEGT